MLMSIRSCALTRLLLGRCNNDISCEAPQNKNGLCTFVERRGAAGPRAVEKLAESVDALGSTQVTIRCDGEPAVIQVAAAVRDAGRTGALTTLETSAPRDHAENGLAERAVGLVGGVVRTLKNETGYSCKDGDAGGVEDSGSSTTPPHRRTWTRSDLTRRCHMSDGETEVTTWRNSVVQSGSEDEADIRPMRRTTENEETEVSNPMKSHSRSHPRE